MQTMWLFVVYMLPKQITSHHKCERCEGLTMGGGPELKCGLPPAMGGGGPWGDCWGGAAWPRPLGLAGGGPSPSSAIRDMYCTTKIKRLWHMAQYCLVTMFKGRSLSLLKGVSIMHPNIYEQASQWETFQVWLFSVHSHFNEWILEEPDCYIHVLIWPNSPN